MMDPDVCVAAIAKSLDDPNGNLVNLKYNRGMWAITVDHKMTEDMRILRRGFYAYGATLEKASEMVIKEIEEWKAKG